MDLAKDQPALLEVLQAQYAIVNDAIAKELQDNRKPVKPKEDIAPETTPKVDEDIDSKIDEALDNDSDNVLDGRVKPKADPISEELTNLEENLSFESEELQNKKNKH